MVGAHARGVACGRGRSEVLSVMIVEELVASGADFERRLVDRLSEIQVDPEVVEGLRAQLSAGRIDVLERWLPRRMLSVDLPTLAAFAAFANARVRALVPTFPELDPSGLVDVARNWCAYRQRLDARVDGRGWTLEVDAEDIGPGECFHVEDWVAVAHGPGLTVARYQTGDWVGVWEEG